MINHSPTLSLCCHIYIYYDSRNCKKDTINTSITYYILLTFSTLTHPEQTHYASLVMLFMLTQTTTAITLILHLSHSNYHHTPFTTHIMHCTSHCIAIEVPPVDPLQRHRSPASPNRGTSPHPLFLLYHNSCRGPTCGPPQEDRSSAFYQ